MKYYMNRIIILFLSVLVLIGCDNYDDRTEVLPSITTNYKSLTMFIGDEDQITVSPQDGGSYTWTSASPDVVTVTNDGTVKALSEGSSDITVRKGDAYVTIPVIVMTEIPLTGIGLNVSEAKVMLNSTYLVQVVSTPDDANDVLMNDFWWWSDDETIATVGAEGQITGRGLGTTQVHYRRGTYEATVDVTVVFSTSTPFMGPHILSQDAPFTLEARNFDFGGEGIAYHDLDVGNTPGATYRADNGDPNSPDVDIEWGGNLGYTNADEWLLYTVEVQDTGIYSFQLEGALDGSAGSFHLDVDGKNQTGTVSFPATGGWGNFVWYYTDNSVELNLSEGTHWIRFYFEGGFNSKTYRFTYLRAN